MPDRDGKGARKGSHRRTVEKKTIGRRQAAGLPCPKAKKK